MIRRLKRWENRELEACCRLAPIIVTMTIENSHGNCINIRIVIIMSNAQPGPASTEEKGCTSLEL